MNLRSALRISFRIHSVLKLGLHPYFGHIQVYSELVLQTQKTENFLLLTDFIDDLWWPEVELNHRHTDFQSVVSLFYEFIPSAIKCYGVSFSRGLHFIPLLSVAIDLYAF